MNYNLENKNKSSIFPNQIIDLFILPFNEIKLKYDKEIFMWKNIEQVFNSLYHNLNNIDNCEDLIKYYYIISLLYLNYTNYLKYSSNKDFNNQDIYKFIDKIKFDKKIIKKIILNSNNQKLRKILKIYNIFTVFKNPKRLNESNILKYVDDYIDTTKQMEKISDMSNSSIKKIVNIIIYRYIVSSTKFKSYHEFVLNKIFLSDINYVLLNFDPFIKSLPHSLKILNLKTKNGSFTINIPIVKLLGFLVGHFKKISFEQIDQDIIISNNKYGGKIIIHIDNSQKKYTEFNINQLNSSLIHFNVDELKEFAFLKKTNTFITINTNSKDITDLSSLLDLTHFLVTSFKMMESYPTDLYESIYPVDYSNYYFLTFCMFLEFLKPNINKDFGVNKFIIDLIKYFYIYSYYDYYFYFSDTLIKTITNNYDFKYDIFQEFTDNLKKVLKLPNELFSFPPFFDIEDDINSCIYYSFEIPSYFKLFDLINAICFVFDKKFYEKNKNNYDLFTIITKHFNVIYTDDNQNDKSIVTDQTKSKKDIIQNNKSNNKSNYKQDLKSDQDSSLELSQTSGFSKKSLDTKSTKSTRSSDTIGNIANDTSDSSHSDLKSRLDTDVLSKFTSKEKKQLALNTTYMELNVENSINCIFNTEK